MTSSPPAIWTIGHSTLEASAFLSLLTAAGLQRLVDVRTFPGSRRYPHFGQEALQKALSAAGIDYQWHPSLGGRRRARPDSPNTAWRHPAFRGYADHMETAAFAAGLAQLEAWARHRRTAYMCSEAVWWRCHRGLISDALKARGWRVLHLSTGKTAEHPYTSAARLEQGRLSYRPTAEAAESLPLFPNG